MLKVLSVVGARPNFMKVAPLHRVFSANDQIESTIVHTGQHYDERMSDIFFRQLELPKPDHYLGIGGGNHTHQTANIMLRFDEILQTDPPDVVLVVGDVNSTMACAIVGVKAGIKTVHVEAGLRSGDSRMPEEVNRLVTDRIVDQLFVTEQSGLDHLAAEGVPDSKIFFVGNVMIDSLIHYRKKTQDSRIAEQLGVEKNGYALVTMHRPSNVDDRIGLDAIIQILEGITQHKKVVMPLHPRTRNSLETHGLLDALESQEAFILTEPLGYIEFLALMEHATLVVTDSGGIQEETTFLQVPCITFRDTTERPVTVDLGTNILMQDLNPYKVLDQVQRIVNGQVKQGQIPPLWDGRAAERIKSILLETAEQCVAV